LNVNSLQGVNKMNKLGESPLCPSCLHFSELNPPDLDGVFC
jgi:hypothetical protein